MQAIFESGDLPSNHSSMGTPAHLFSWDDLRGLLERHDCDVVVASAANFLSIGNDEICERWLHDEAMWERFLAWEIDQLRAAGCDRRRNPHHRRGPRSLTAPRDRASGG